MLRLNQDFPNILTMFTDLDEGNQYKCKLNFSYPSPSFCARQQYKSSNIFDVLNG